MRADAIGLLLFTFALSLAAGDSHGTTALIFEVEDAAVADVLGVLRDVSGPGELVADPSVELESKVSIRELSTDGSRMLDDVCGLLGLRCEQDEHDSTLRVWRSSGPRALVRLTYDSPLSWRSGEEGAWKSLRGTAVLPPRSGLYLRAVSRVELATGQGEVVVEGPTTLTVDQETLLEPGHPSANAPRVLATRIQLRGPAQDPVLSWNPGRSAKECPLGRSTQLPQRCRLTHAGSENCRWWLSAESRRGRLRLSGRVESAKERAALTQTLAALTQPPSGRELEDDGEPTTGGELEAFLRAKRRSRDLVEIDLFAP